MGKSLDQIPQDKLTIGLPVISNNNIRGFIAYRDETPATGLMLLIKKETGHFSLLTYNRRDLEHWSYDSSKG